MSIRRLFVSALLLSGAATLSATDVLMEGVDTARTGWVKDEKIFTLANVGSTKFQWRVQLNSTSRAMHNLFPPLIAENVMTPQGRLEREGRHARHITQLILAKRLILFSLNCSV